MKVILTEKITKLGNIGDTVEVKTGYARNYLLPNNKALRFTKENVALFEAKKAEIVARHENAKKAAESKVDAVKNAKLHMIRQAGDVVHPSFLKDFKADLEEELHIKFDGNLNEFGNMHINQLCKLCIAKAAENDKAR